MNQYWNESRETAEKSEMVQIRSYSQAYVRQLAPREREREMKRREKTTHTRVSVVCRTISKRHNRKYWFHKHNWIGKLKNDRFINNPIFFLTPNFFVQPYVLLFIVKRKERWNCRFCLSLSDSINGPHLATRKKSFFSVLLMPCKVITIHVR